MIQFILNDREISHEHAPATLTLDFLRHHQRLTGTKEGCKEGDCGACMVLVGSLQSGNISYKPLMACLLPIAELHGKHLLTIEGLNMSRLLPSQAAIVAEGASQCGFCTPGIVVSLTGYLMQAGAPLTKDSIKQALSGHLCRCTGYRSLKAVIDHLRTQFGEKTPGVTALIQANALPAYLTEIPDRLKKIPPHSQSEFPVSDYLLAGGTDLYVQKGDLLPDTNVELLNITPERIGITRQNGHLRIGALTTFEEFGDSPLVHQLIPQIKEYLSLIASWQIRLRATIGGNIINASPIGDLTILLMAMDARLLLRAGENLRPVPLRTFYRGYKQMDKTPTERLQEIYIPVTKNPTVVDFEKVSKRMHLDIASVNSAIWITRADEQIQDIGLAVGGVAPVPLFLKETCQFLSNQPIIANTIKEALAIAQREISPISDVRGSAAYKRLLTRQLLIAHFTKLFPDRLAVSDFVEMG